jgi:hypothetical protein
MNNLKLFTLIIGTIFILSCDDNYEISGVDMKELQLNTPEDAKEQVGPYADFFLYHKSGLNTESEFMFFEDPNNPLNVLRGNKCSADVFIENVDYTHTNRGILYLEEIGFKYDQNLKQYPILKRIEDCNEFNKFYGKENTIKLVENNGKIAFEEKMYFPNQFNKLIHPIAYKKDENGSTLINNSLELEWNADLKNQAGIIFLLLWDGHVKGEEVVGRARKHKEVTRLLWKKTDDGKAKINEEFFRGIPKNGVFTLYMYRGAGKNIPVTFSDGKTEYFNLHNKISVGFQYVKG